MGLVYVGMFFSFVLGILFLAYGMMSFEFGFSVKTFLSLIGMLFGVFLLKLAIPFYMAMYFPRAIPQMEIFFDKPIVLDPSLKSDLKEIEKPEYTLQQNSNYSKEHTTEKSFRYVDYPHEIQEDGTDGTLFVSYVFKSPMREALYLNYKYDGERSCEFIEGSMSKDKGKLLQVRLDGNRLENFQSITVLEAFNVSSRFVVMHLRIYSDESLYIFDKTLNTLNSFGPKTVSRERFAKDEEKNSTVDKELDSENFKVFGVDEDSFYLLCFSKTMVYPFEENPKMQGKLVNGFSHVYHFSSTYPQGKEILKVSIKFAQVEGFAIKDKKLYLEMFDGRKNENKQTSYWDLDVSQLKK